MGERAITAPSRTFGEPARLIGPYVPTLVIDWLRERPEERHRELDSTLVFADISGFTRMTEMLGGLGKIGAEEIAGLINGTFEPLLATAYSYGAGLIKFGGDATLLLFQGPDAPLRGCRAAWEMQRVMRSIGSLRTSRGPLRLRMSIGVHSGLNHCFLVGEPDHRELVVSGPGPTILTEMEKAADAGQIVVSPGTAEALERAGERRPTVAAGTGWLLRHAPEAEAHAPGQDTIEYGDLDLATTVSGMVRDHILGGGTEHEHRHAAIGFISFSGVDRLLREHGPAEAAAAIEDVICAAQAAARSHEVAFLATDIAADGGKIILCAGAPRRVGHDEARMAAALRSALDAGSPLSLSAGATAGRVFAGDYGPTYRRTYSLLGDSVNLAARLMAHGTDGELLVDESLVSALGPGFAAEMRPPFAAKGKSQPVTPYNILTAVAARAKAEEGRAPLIGREAELERLLALAAAAAAGSGSALEVVGDPGIGKSLLLAEVEARVEADVLWVDGDVYAAARAYAPFEKLMRAALGLPGDATQDAVATALQAAAAESAPELLPWLPLIGLVARLELPSTREVEQTDESQRKARMEELTSQLLGGLLGRPTVLVFNDAHLMDLASRELIGRLALDAESRPWLLLASRRPEGEAAFGDFEPQRLELGGLSPEDAASLLAIETRANPLPPHRLAAVAARAEGNPLFLRELAAQLSDAGAAESLPRSVEEAVAARIDRLAPGERRTLRAAAVLGMDVDVELLEEVLSAEQDRVGQLAERLDALTELLAPVDASRLRFSQQLVREVAYEGLPYSRRANLHARTAAAIQKTFADDLEPHAELLSVHLLQGQEFEPAWRFARMAGDRARSHYANAQAAESYRRALSAAERVPELAPGAIADVETALAEVSVELGELKAAEIPLRRALRRVREEPVSAARLELKMARLRDICGQHTSALRWASRAAARLATLDGREPATLRAQLAARRARISYRLGRHRRALRHADEAIELARQAGDLMTLAEALEYADLSAIELGQPAGRRAEQALAIYSELGALGDEARVQNTLGMLAYFRGAWSEALEHYQAAETAQTRAGKFFDAALAVANAAEILADQDRLDEAQAAVERAMLVWRGCGADAEVAFGEYQLARIAARQDRFEEAFERLTLAREHFHATGELTEVVVVDAIRAETWLGAGEPSAALKLAEETLAGAKALGGVGAATPLLHRVRGLALVELGKVDEGDTALRESLGLARRRDADHEVAFTLRALLAAGLGESHQERQDWGRELTQLGEAMGLPVATAPRT